MYYVSRKSAPFSPEQKPNWESCFPATVGRDPGTDGALIGRWPYLATRMH